MKNLKKELKFNISKKIAKKPAGHLSLLLPVVDIVPHGHLHPLHYHVHFHPNLKPHPACPDKTINPSHAAVCPQNDKLHNYTTFMTNCNDETNKMLLSHVILESSQNSPHGKFYV